MRTRAAEIAEGERATAEDLDAFADALRSSDPVRQRSAAYAIEHAVRNDRTEVDPTGIPFAAGIRTDDPMTVASTLDALGAVGESRPVLIREVLDDVVERLRGGDATVRASACSALATLADDSPTAIRTATEGLIACAEDPSPAVRVGAFTTLGHLVRDEHEPGLAATPAAVAALRDAAGHVRGSALTYLGAVAGTEPGRLVGHVDSIRTPLADPVGSNRASAAYVVSELVKHDPDAVTSALDRIAGLLDDPDLVARQNAAYTLLVWDRDVIDSTAGGGLPVAEIGTRLSTLLATDVISVRTNAGHLAVTVIEEAPAAVPDPGEVTRLLRDVRSDDGVDVPDRLIDRSIDRLDARGERDAGGRGAEGDRGHGGGSPPDGRDVTPSETPDDESPGSRIETAVFGADSNTCDGCGTALDRYDDLAFCPECGAEV